MVGGRCGNNRTHSFYRRKPVKAGLFSNRIIYVKVRLKDELKDDDVCINCGIKRAELRLTNKNDKLKNRKEESIINEN